MRLITTLQVFAPGALKIGYEEYSGQSGGWDAAITNFSFM